MAADLAMREVLAKMVPRIASDDQKQWQCDVYVDPPLIRWPKEITLWIKLSLLITRGRFNIIRKQNAKHAF